MWESQTVHAGHQLSALEGGYRVHPKALLNNPEEAVWSEGSQGRALTTAEAQDSWTNQCLSRAAPRSLCPVSALGQEKALSPLDASTFQGAVLLPPPILAPTDRSPKPR